MREYEYNERHDRTIFTARDVLNIRPVLMGLANTHPTFLSIRKAFESETVNISSKQADALDRSLQAESKPTLRELASRCPFTASVSYRGSSEAAMRSIISHLECGSYGDWTHSDDFLALPGGFMFLEVNADRPLYVAFSDARDLDTATIALGTPGWML